LIIFMSGGLATVGRTDEGDQLPAGIVTLTRSTAGVS